MATRVLQLGFLFALALVVAVSGCTDGRIPIKKIPVRINQSLPPQTLVEVAQVRFDGQDMNIWTQVRKGSSLFLTGTPFGFARWDIGANPESPQLTFSVSNQIDRLKPKWVAPWYASGALAVTGNAAIMSGQVGVSVIDMSETHRPREIQRYPAYDENSDDVVADEAYIWSAAVMHPTQPFLYAFRQQDYVLTYQISGGRLRLVGKDQYADGGEVTCCADSATTFNNELYLAFRSRLLFFSFGGRALTNAREFVGLQATSIASTSRYLYVAHNPSYGSAAEGPTYPAGIYIFDTQGQNVGFLQSNPINFNVHPNDTHLYANEDSASMKIYRIQWTR